jgi:hypothetical protein
MPFKAAATLPPAPTVRIFFCGLLVVKPTANGDACEVFIHRTALDHELSIEIRLKRSGLPDAVVMRQLGTLEFARPVPPNPLAVHGLLITASVPAGVRRYDGVKTSEGDTLNLAIDLNKLHPGKTGVNEAEGQPSIFLNDALFYSADQTDSALQVDLQRGGATVRPLTPFASIIGANIYDRLVTVEWRLKGVLQTLMLTQPAAGFSYEIYVKNDPTFQPPPPPGIPPHDELREYYKLLPNVPVPEQFNLLFRSIPPINLLSAKLDDRGSIRIPCMSVIDDS